MEKSEKEILLLNSNKAFESLLKIIESIPSRKRGTSIETNERDKNTIKLLNLQIWENYQEVTLAQAIKKVRLSHKRIMDLIESHTNEEIMTKRYYKWTKTSNLHSYFAANTSNHYSWAIKKCETIGMSIACS